MDNVDERASAHISSHIIIRDKDSGIVLLSRNVTKSLRVQNEIKLEKRND